MSTTCAFCERSDWLDTGICAGCAGTSTREFVFLAPRSSARDAAGAEAQLRDVLGAQLERQSLREAARGRQPLALLPRALAHRAVRRLESAGLAARVLPRHALHRALPLGFAVMLLAIVASA